MTDGQSLHMVEGLAPVQSVPGDAIRPPQPGIALCMSGGGYRAMLFHVGSLWRLNELGYLPKLNRISSVSGGSITAAVLGDQWQALGFDGHGVAQQFDAVVAPIRRLAAKSIDIRAVFAGLFLPGSISDRIVKYFKAELFQDRTLQHLPDLPRFVINATNVQSGALWRFSKPYMWDWRVGKVEKPTVALATAVAASAAFPPFLSPLRLTLDPSKFVPDTGFDLQRSPYTSEVMLSDGGVCDNLGLETAWKKYQTILVSNGGGKMAPEPAPSRDWIRHSKRVLDVIDNQVRSLRQRQVISSFQVTLPNGSHLRDGSYWGIRTDIADYQLPDSLQCPHAKTMALAEIQTGLTALDATRQERLINWGYAVCDAAMRRYVDSTLQPPTGFPYPKTAV